MVVVARHGEVTRTVDEEPAGENRYTVDSVFHMGVIVHQLLQVKDGGGTAGWVGEWVG